MATSDGGKGSDRRPGKNYEENWERIFRPPRCSVCGKEFPQGANVLPARGTCGCEREQVPRPPGTLAS